MSKTKALIFDLDGTALYSPAEELPTKRLRDAVKLLKNNYFLCAATGRPWAMAKEVIDFLGLKDPCIVSAGTQIFDPSNHKNLWQANIDRGDVDKIRETLSKYDSKVVINDFSAEDYRKGGVSYRHIDSSIDIYYIDAVYMPKEVYEPLLLDLSSIEGISFTLGVSHRPGLLDIHITSKEATKEHTVNSLLDKLGVKKAYSWGFGDGHNDIHLFNAVGHKVAMGNAVPELKAVAHEIIGDVKDDGLAAYFEKLAKKL